jgi:hypothetical protein
VLAWAAIVRGVFRSLGELLPFRADRQTRGEEGLMDKSESDLGAVDRFRAAREERDRRAAQYDAASGSPAELPAFTELQAAEQQLAARKAWLSWTEGDY